jgi:hypothetical protein
VARGDRARSEIQRSPRRRTANSAERTLTAVMAVPHPGLWEKSVASIGSNGSTSSGDFSEIEAAIAAAQAPLRDSSDGKPYPSYDRVIAEFLTAL